MAVRRVRDQSLAARSAAVQADHVGAKAGFVDKHQLSHIQTQHLDTPSQSLLMHIRPLLLFGMQYFF